MSIIEALLRHTPALKAAVAKLDAVIHHVTRSEAGVGKRIDENRELLELLKLKAPDFLEENFWVEGWLASQDRFLTGLARTAEVEPRVGGTFPRPWPGDERYIRD